MSQFKFDNLNNHVKKMDEIYFRGDTREPSEIFEFGFQRRGSTYEYYKHTKKMREPTFRIWCDDIDPSSAVCVTAHMDCAPIFPVEFDKPQSDTWIYIVQGSNMFETHVHQTGSLKFAQELAVRDIPSGDVICAIKCRRFINIHPEMDRFSWAAGMHYQLTGDIIWNPKLQNEFETPSKKLRKQKIIDYVAQRKDKYIECPIPQTAEDLQPRSMNNEKPTELSEQEHQDKVALIAFWQHMAKGDQDKALEALKNCSNKNQLIPGTKVNLIEYAVDKNANQEIMRYLLSNTSIDYILATSIKDDPNYVRHVLAKAINALAPIEQLRQLEQWFVNIEKKRDSMFGLAFNAEQKNHIKILKDLYLQIVKNNPNEEIQQKARHDVKNPTSIVNCHRDFISFGSTKTTTALKNELRKIKQSANEQSTDSCQYATLI